MALKPKKHCNGVQQRRKGHHDYHDQHLGRIPQQHLPAPLENFHPSSSSSSFISISAISSSISATGALVNGSRKRISVFLGLFSYHAIYGETYLGYLGVEKLRALSPCHLTKHAWDICARRKAQGACTQTFHFHQHLGIMTSGFMEGTRVASRLAYLIFSLFSFLILTTSNPKKKLSNCDTNKQKNH